MKTLLRIKFLWACMLLTILSAGNVDAQVIISNGTPVSVNFDGIGNTATASLPSGIRLTTGPDYTAGTSATTVVYGTSGSGAVTGTSGGGAVNWANGVTASSTDRAVGFLTTGSYSSPRSIILEIQNNGAANITSLAIAFDYEKYRSGSRAFAWTFFHGATATSVSTAATAGDQSYAADANNTVINNPPTSTNKSFTISGLNIAPASKYYLRWAFTGAGGSTNCQGMGVDNISLTATYSSSSTVNASVTDLTDFGSVNTGSSSASQSFDVDGTGLSTDIVINAPANFEVSLNNAAWLSSVSLTPVSGSVTTTTVYARFTPLTGGAKSGNITLNSTGAIEKTVGVSGTGISPISDISDIIEDAAFLYPTNIAYATYQATDITDSNSIEVAQFTIRDGGSLSPDSDSLSTELTSVQLSLSNFADVRRVALYDGTTELGEMDAAASMTFPVSLTAADNATKNFSVRATFKSTVTDNHQFIFKITAATANVAGSTFAAADAGGAETNSTGDDNKIEVTGTQLVFNTNAVATPINTAMSPNPTVRVLDANGNRDLDFTGNIDITSTGTLSVTPTTVAAVSGQASFTALTHTATGIGLQLTAASSGFTAITSALFDIYNPIFSNVITGTNPNLSNPYTTGQVVDPNITATGIGRGGTIVGTNANDRYNANTWNSPSFDANKYFTFTLTPNPTKEIDFSSLIYTAQISGVGALTGFEVRSSIDSYATAIGTATAGVSPGANVTIDLSAPQFQNVATSITFRIYGWGASSNTSTFSINNFSFNGEVTNSTAPNITASATSLTNLDYFVNNGPSAVQTFTVDAANLSPANDQLVVEADNTDFEVSTDNITYGQNATINYTGGAITAATVYVRTAAGLDVGTYNGEIMVSGGTAPSDSVTVQGIVRVPFDVPYSNTFRTQAANNDAVAQGFTVSGVAFNPTGYDQISVNGYIETPVIDFTQQTNLEVYFDGATFGGNANQTLELQISTDGGSNYTALQSVTYLNSTFVTTRVLIDVSLYPSSNGKLKIQMVSGTNTTRFRDLVIADYTVWESAAWSNGTPSAIKVAVFEDDYEGSGLFTARHLMVNSGDVSFDPGATISLQDEITVNGGSLSLGNNVNLLQANTQFTNTGAISIERQVTLKRLDYVYWSSPVNNQGLSAFSEETLVERFYTLDEPTNAFIWADPVANQFLNAKGYMIRAPNTFTTTPEIFSGVFTGVPHNGNYTIAGTSLDASHGFNMIGNPYPSPINITTFKAANPSIGTLYFWTHSNQTPGGANYATYTTTGAAAAPGGEVPNGTIQIGQGFIAKLASAATISFTNAMRVDNHQNQFFRNANDENQPERHRFWLNLTKDSTNYNQILVGYVEGATDAADFDYDGKVMDSNPTTLLYNKIGSDKYIVQGKALPFSTNDIVALGFKAAQAGTYTISLANLDGVFAGDQDIFIKDNLTGTVHNIKNSAYSFASLEGTFENRFDIVYQSTLGVDNPAADASSIVVFKKDNVLHINAGATLISEVKVFDIRGRLVYQKNVANATTVTLNDLKVANQVLLVQITSNENKTFTKKVVN